MSGQALAYCSIALYHSQDSTLAGGVLTNENGGYKFENVAFGRYYIQTQYIGYSKAFVSLPLFAEGQTQLNLPAIRLDPDPRTLREVNVTAGRQNVDNKIDRQVYRADKFLNSQGGTAIDVLKNTPSVTVNRRRGHHASGLLRISGTDQWKAGSVRSDDNTQPVACQYDRKYRSHHVSVCTF